MKSLLLLCLVAGLTACYPHEDIDTLLASHKSGDIIRANYLIGEQKDTTYVCRLLSDIHDGRITHVKEFYGTSVYQSKVAALRKISGLNPPHKITYEPDAAIIAFYKNWAKEKGFKCEE